MSKIYTGTRTNNSVEVSVFIDKNTSKARKHPLRHIPFHSATKGDLNWGYGGSGPADLALAILVDYFKERAPSEGYRARAECNTWMVKSKAWKYHQEFKWHFVAQFEDEWELCDTQIEAWLKEQEASGFTRDEAAAKVGKWVRTRIAWATIETGTIGKVVKAEQKAEVWKVVIRWDWPKTWQDRLSRYEYEQFLEEVEGG